MSRSRFSKSTISVEEIENTLGTYNTETNFNYIPSDINIINKIINKVNNLNLEPLSKSHKNIYPKGKYGINFFDSAEGVMTNDNLKPEDLPKIKSLDILFIIWFFTKNKNKNIKEIVFPSYLEMQVDKAYNFSEFYQNVMLPTIILVRQTTSNSDEINDFIDAMIEHLPFAYESKNISSINMRGYRGFSGGRYKKSKKNKKLLKSKKY